MPPVQVVDALAGVAMSVPAGRLSVKARPVSGLVSLLVILNVNVVVALGAITEGANALLKVG